MQEFVFQIYDVYETITINPDFYKKLISYLPEKYQKNFNPANIRSMWDINEIVLGTKLPNIEDMSEEKLDRINPVIKFYIIYARYLTMIGFRKKDEAKELWNKFYGKVEYKIII